MQKSVGRLLTPLQSSKPTGATRTLHGSLPLRKFRASKFMNWAQMKLGLDLEELTKMGPSKSLLSTLKNPILIRIQCTMRMTLKEDSEFQDMFYGV